MQKSTGSVINSLDDLVVNVDASCAVGLEFKSWNGQIRLCSDHLASSCVACRYITDMATDSLLPSM